MVQEELIDMTDEVDKFRVSTIVVQAGIQELLPAWNHHSIPGSCTCPIEIDESLKLILAKPYSILFFY